MRVFKTEQAIRNAERRVEERRQREEAQQKKASSHEPHAHVEELEQEGEVFDGTLDELAGDVESAFGQAPEAKARRSWVDNAMESLGQVQGETPEAGED